MFAKENLITRLIFSFTFKKFLYNPTVLQGNYRDHLRRSQHGQEEPLKCEICAKGFYSQHALKLHHEYEHGGQVRENKPIFYN